MMSFLSTLSFSSISCILTAVIIRCSQVLQDLPEHRHNWGSGGLSELWDNWRAKDCPGNRDKFYRTSILFVEFFTFV
jgi:hypothetical protein